MANTSPRATERLDAVIVGAGFTGLYMLHKLRESGLRARIYEAGSDVGGTWYWNRYPGARCDVESVDYSYSFSPELEQEWNWQERYPAQPEILEYLRHVAERFDLRRDIVFDTRVAAAHYDEPSATWTVYPEQGDPEQGDPVRATFCVMATGCLSVPQIPDIPGLDEFAGPVYYTGRWPHREIDFTGQRVGIIGTGSSAVQSIPVLSEQAAQLTVFQRTPAYTVPARNHPLEPEVQREIKKNYRERRRLARRSQAGMVREDTATCALEVDEQARRAEYERRWEIGGPMLLGAYADLASDAAANETAAEFVREKTRERVDDPDVAEALTPRSYPLGTKRICVDIDYLETFNRDNVSLVDSRAEPLRAITERGVRTAGGEHEFDSLVLATGFDAMTGALTRIDVRGRDGAELAAKWSAGPRTYLGLGVAGFPNMFLLAGPGSPSVLTNMITSIEQHVEWTARCIEHVRAGGYESIEATAAAEDEWVAHVNEVADGTLFPRGNSWYLGANIPGKERVFMPYAGGFATYEDTCEQIAADDYRGFLLK
ncbi:MAG: NAD(P)/FAD-dependent oxidoreductase [Saccharopolyspora sp.]|uniref:flavin-containing monooxygenase n=1 Tax=Saccharopolyspora sp. TaxID=33915 RepID=UPI0025D1E89D|nr:NAD(P)/FAD-dependent oxidoreductase [Saccharopolyspora sp.]MBQ6642894.1 NAD(P)/FAD-dependent oxidoreductase [Saccharopolyspora sp.]